MASEQERQEELNKAMEALGGFILEDDQMTWSDEPSGQIMVFVDQIHGGYGVTNGWPAGKGRFETAEEAAAFAKGLLPKAEDAFITF